MFSYILYINIIIYKYTYLFNVLQLTLTVQITKDVSKSQQGLSLSALKALKLGISQNIETLPSPGSNWQMTEVRLRITDNIRQNYVQS